MTFRDGLQDEKLRVLGVAGPRTAGKTFLMVEMVRKLRHLAEKGDTSLSLSGISTTESRFAVIEGSLHENGVKPGPTPTDNDTGRNLAWRVLRTRTGKTHAAGLLALHDAAGETWSNPDLMERESFTRYLSMIHGLVFLIDGARLAADLGRNVEDAWQSAPATGDSGRAERIVLSRLVELMPGKTAGLALVISKFDHIAEMSPTLAAPDEGGLEEILKISGRADILAAARNRFGNVRLFALSSLGFLPGSEDVEDGRLLIPQKLQPIGVVEPFLFLLDVS